MCPLVQPTTSTKFSPSSRPTTIIPPAKPILASSLLSHEQEKQGGGKERCKNHVWHMGIGSLDSYLTKHALWSGGKVIGIIDDSSELARDDDSDLLSDSPGGRGNGKRKGNRRNASSLISQLVLTHLASLYQREERRQRPEQKQTLDSVQSRAANPATEEGEPQEGNEAREIGIWMVTPVVQPVVHGFSSVSAALSPASLASALTDADLPHSLLDSVALLQYLDFAGLADSVAEVSDALFKESRYGHRKNANGDGEEEGTKKTGKMKILIVSGLVQTLKQLFQHHRGSSYHHHYRGTGGVIAKAALSTNALLAPFLRSLTKLSRSHPEVLILISVDDDGSGLGFLDPDPLMQPSESDKTRGGRAGYSNNSSLAGGQMLSSAFAPYHHRSQQDNQRIRGHENHQDQRAKGGTEHIGVGDNDLDGDSTKNWQKKRRGRSNPSFPSFPPTTTPLPTTTAHLLVSALDTIVLVHTWDRDRDVVEVLLDRVGSGTGAWAVWDK